MSWVEGLAALGLGFRIAGLGRLRVWGLGLRGFGFRGFGFRVWGFRGLGV